MTTDRERVFRRRRRVALAALGLFVLLVIWLIGAVGGGTPGHSAPRAKTLPDGSRLILPAHRVVAYYGAPQDTALGVLGIGTPQQAGRKLLARARRYRLPGRPVLPAFELLAAIAHSAPGPDGLHRQRQSRAVIARYLAAARKIGALMILDIQPGQANFVDETVALEPYLRQPDVGLALDSEWSVPPGVEPGQVIGSTDAQTINRVSYYLARLVHDEHLPQKLLLVHQFTEGMVTGDSAIRPRPGVAIVSNIDGFGTPELKTGVYSRLTRPPRVLPRGAGYFNGLKLFFEEDTGLMSPARVLALHPKPDVVVYE